MVSANRQDKTRQDKTEKRAGGQHNIERKHYKIVMGPPQQLNPHENIFWKSNLSSPAHCGLKEKQGTFFVWSGKTETPERWYYSWDRDKSESEWLSYVLHQRRAFFLPNQKRKKQFPHTRSSINPELRFSQVTCNSFSFCDLFTGILFSFLCPFRMISFKNIRFMYDNFTRPLLD